MNRRFFVCAMLASAVVQDVRAASTWVGGMGSWSDAAMWFGGPVPTAGADVAIDAGNATVSTVVVGGTDAIVVNGLVLDAEDTLRVMPGVHNASGTFTINGTLETTGAGNVTLGFNFSPIAPIVINGTGRLNFNATGTSLAGLNSDVTIGSGITTSGPFNLAGAHTTNNGTITLAGAGRKVLIGDVNDGIPNPDANVNNGSIEIGGGGTLPRIVS